MKKNFFLGFIALAALTVSSCSNDADLTLKTPDNAIEFGTYLGRDAQTRAHSIESPATLATDGGFGVFAYYTDEGSYNEGTSPCNFMNNQQVTGTTNNGETSWTYTPVKYWPNDPGDKLSFFAYAPYDGETGDNANENISFASSLTTPLITFSVNNDVKKQTDLLISKTENINLTKNNSSDGIHVKEKVNFEFAHALSRIGFTVKAITDEVTAGATPKKLDGNTTIVVREVRLVGAAGTGNTQPTEPVFHTSGSLNMNQPNVNTYDNSNYKGVTWTVASDNAKQFFTLDNSNFVAQNGANAEYNEKGFVLTENETVIGTGNANSTIANPLNAEDSYVMIIPQDLSNGFYVYVEYDVITIDEKISSDNSSYDKFQSKITNHISTPVYVNFESGKAYSLNLQLGMTSVKLSATVGEWIDGGDVSVNLPANTPEP